jgi:hypothetical protein
MPDLSLALLFCESGFQEKNYYCIDSAIVIWYNNWSKLNWKKILKVTAILRE